MNTSFPAILLASAALLTTSAQAVDFDDYARVTRVTPQTEQVNEPQQVCSDEVVQVPVQSQQQRGIGGSILGGVAGGLLGNQVGGGNGRTAATAAGAIAGAIIGDRMENNQANAGPATQQVTQRRCRTVEHWVTRNNGYLVNYDYHGRQFSTVLPYNPGERLRVRVGVTPAN